MGAPTSLIPVEAIVAGMLLGRATWELFAGIWPSRDGAFAGQMNAVDKLIVTSHPVDEPGRWPHSSVLTGPLRDAVIAERRTGQPCSPPPALRPARHATVAEVSGAVTTQYPAARKVAIVSPCCSRPRGALPAAAGRPACDFGTRRKWSLPDSRAR